MRAEAAGLVAAQASAKRLRRVLHPSSVLIHYGHTPDTVSYSRLHYVNPFRSDTRPSLDVWFDHELNEWRIGDFAEGSQYSAIDLIQKFNPGWSDADAIELGRVLYAKQLVEGAPYTVRNTSAQHEFRWPNPKHDDPSALRWHHYYSRTHPLLPPVGFLRQHFDLVIMPNEMVYAPYYDQQDQIVGYKTLSRKGKRAGIGSKVTLYGTRRALRMFRETSTPVVVCEGESDAWIMEYLYGDDYVVIAFPGANLNVSELFDGYGKEVFDGREFILCFDGDAAGTSGREATASWIHSRGGLVSIVPMPRGKDVADLNRPDLEELFYSWRMPYGELQRVGAFGRGYRRLSSDGSPGSEITNWTFDPEELLIGEDSETYAIRGRIQPNNRPAIITAYQFRSAQKLIDWSQAHARGFYGTTQDTQKLGSFLLSEAMLCPVGRITTRVGLHRGDFVWADDSIGDNSWHYLPRPTGLSLRGEQTWVRPRTKSQALRTLRLLADLHRHEVTMPILAWLAVAPLRPLFQQFPILHLSGTSGSGKTTLTQTMMTLFSGSQITSNLTTTTPFAISAHFMASNGFPIWFDEYRPGARDDAKKTLDQLLRDTYTGQVSTKGAMNANKAEVTEILTDTPVIVTGEDTLSEKSHVDRSIIINIPRTGKNTDALHELEYDIPLAYVYLEWLHKNYLTDNVVLPEIEVEDAERFSNRQLHNFRVLQYGYNLLQAFTEYLCTTTDTSGAEIRSSNWKLPDKSWELILKDADIANQENPIHELIRWAYEKGDCGVERLEHLDSYAVSCVELMRIQNSHMGPKLPIPFERHTALARWLEDNLGAEKQVVSFAGKPKTVYVVSHEELMQSIL